MALDSAYADADRYFAEMRLTPVDDVVNVLEGQLEATSRLIEQRLGRHFNIDTDGSARIFYPQLDIWGHAQQTLFVGDIADITALSIKVDTDGDGSFADETAYALSDYELLPRGALDGPALQPYNEISIPPWSSKGWWYPARTQVTAIWGWPGGTPEAIISACVQLTGILRGEGPRAMRRYEDMNQVFGMSREAQNILDMLLNRYSPTGGAVVG